MDFGNENFPDDKYFLTLRIVILHRYTVLIDHGWSVSLSGRRQTHAEHTDSASWRVYASFFVRQTPGEVIVYTFLGKDQEPVSLIIQNCVSWERILLFTW